MAFVAATLLALLAAEVILRVMPIRGLAYQSFYYDQLTGGRHYPNSTVMYRAEDGREIERHVNRWGFLDVDHDLAKPAGTVRIAFFGDSYTAARQVDIEDTFFRCVQQALDRETAGTRRYEVLAFGISGRSTLQSYLECTRWLDRAGLDVVVYVFSENDPGDQIREVNRIDGVPYAELSGDTFTVDDSFRRRFHYKTSRLHRIVQFLKARSLVMSTIEQRLRLLRRHGVDVAAPAGHGPGAGTEAREAGLRATAPSTWPDSLVSYAETLGERIILRWRDVVESAGGTFVIVRVPRESQLDRPVADQDAWAPWLQRVCAEAGIPLIDPTPELRRALAAGESPYGDHFTPAGHRAFCQAILSGLSDAGATPDN
jgi:hypothetical protein